MERTNVAEDIPDALRAQTMPMLAPPLAAVLLSPIGRLECALRPLSRTPLPLKCGSISQNVPAPAYTLPQPPDHPDQ